MQTTRETDKSFTQWVGDNVDHNVASIDGRGSFHGMGLIAVSSPLNVNNMEVCQTAVKRVQRINASSSLNVFESTD
jgi:hypothetical protein